MTGNPHQPQSWNAFAYVHNNPLRFVDPFGLQAFGGAGGSGSWNQPVIGVDCGSPTSPCEDQPITVIVESPHWSEDERRRRADEAVGNEEAAFLCTMNQLWNARNSVTNMSLAEHYAVSVNGIQAFADGIVPDLPLCGDLCDPFAHYGFYDVSDPGMRSAQVIGAATRDAELAILSAGSTMETRAGAEGGNWVTNNAFRWGKGSWGKSSVERWHFHAGKAFMRHHLPYDGYKFARHFIGKFIRPLL